MTYELNIRIGVRVFFDQGGVWFVLYAFREELGFHEALKMEEWHGRRSKSLKYTRNYHRTGPTHKSGFYKSSHSIKFSFLLCHVS